MSEATAKTWSIIGPSDGHAGDKGDYAILDSDGFIIAECFKVVGKDEKRPAGATAALIVRDHNAHDSLVETLGKVLDALEARIEPGQEGFKEWNEGKAALEEAKS